MTKTYTFEATVRICVEADDIGEAWLQADYIAGGIAAELPTGAAFVRGADGAPEVNNVRNGETV